MNKLKKSLAFVSALTMMATATPVLGTFGTLMGTSIVASAEADPTIVTPGQAQTYTKVADATSSATVLEATSLGTNSSNENSVGGIDTSTIPDDVIKTKDFYVFDATGNQNKVKINLPSKLFAAYNSKEVKIAADGTTIDSNGLVTLKDTEGHSAENTYYKVTVTLALKDNSTNFTEGLKAVATVTKVDSTNYKVATANTYADFVLSSSNVFVKTAETDPTSNTPGTITITEYAKETGIPTSGIRYYWDAEMKLHKYKSFAVSSANTIVTVNTLSAIPESKTVTIDGVACTGTELIEPGKYYVDKFEGSEIVLTKLTEANTVDVAALITGQTELDKNVKFITNTGAFGGNNVTIVEKKDGESDNIATLSSAETQELKLTKNVDSKKAVSVATDNGITITITASNVADGIVWGLKDGSTTEYENKFEAGTTYDADLCKVTGTTEYKSLKQGDQFKVTYVEADITTNKDVVKEDIIKTVSDGSESEYGYKATLNAAKYSRLNYPNGVILRYTGTTELKTGNVVTGTQFNFVAEDAHEYRPVAGLKKNYFFTNAYDGDVTSDAEVKDAVKIEADPAYNVYFKKDVTAAGNGTLLTKDTKTNTYLITRSENKLADNEIYYVSNVVPPEKSNETVTKAGSVTISVMKFDMISSDLVREGKTFTQNDIIYIDSNGDTISTEPSVKGISDLTINNSAAYDKYLGTAIPDYGKNLLGRDDKEALITIDLAEGNLYTMKKIASDNKLTAFPADTLFTLKNNGGADENDDTNTNFIEVSSKYNAINSTLLDNNDAVNKFDKIVNSNAPTTINVEGEDIPVKPGPDVTIVIKGFGADITKTLKAGNYYKTNDANQFLDKDGNIILKADNKTPITKPSESDDVVYVVPESFMIDVDITAPECLRVQSMAEATDGSRTYTFVKSTYNTCGADTAKDTCVWAFDEATGTLSITGEGAIASYSDASYQPWKDNASKITKVVIGEGVTEIGAYNFAGLTKLTSVELPDTLKKIGANAFDGANLTYTKANPLVISASVNEIGTNAFANNTTLGFVKFEEKKKSSLVTVSYANDMFAGSFTSTATTETPVTPLIISYYAGTDIADTLASTPAVPEDEKNITGTIYKSLISVLSEKGTCGPKATWALMSDGTLTIGGEGEVDTAEWDTIDTTIKITKLVVEEGITSLNVSMNLSEVTSVELPESLTTLGRSCFEGAKITAIDLKNVTEIADSAFRDCTALESVTSDKLVKIGGNAFLGCTNLGSITLPVDLESIGAKAFQNTMAGFTINGYVGVASDYANKYDYISFNNISKFASGQLTIAKKLELTLTFANIDVKDATFDPAKNEQSASFKVYVNDEEVTVTNNEYKMDIAPKDAKTPVKWEVKKVVTMKNGSSVETSVESGEYSVQEYLDGYLSYDLENTSDVEALLAANGKANASEEEKKAFIAQFKKDKALINSLDEYCAATAGYFGTGSKFVADEAFEKAYTMAVSETKDENGKTVAPIIDEIQKFNNGTSASDISNLAKQGVTLYGTSLILKDTITVRAYVKFAANSELLAFIPEDGDLKFAKELADGSKLYYQDSAEFTVDEYNTLKNLNVDIKTDNKSAKITFNLSVAPLAYAEKVINAASNADNTDLVNVCKALVNLVAQVELKKAP